ncbi:MerR family transcriptional regulator [Alicyclobacillus contaminans]|uniref:MerR family transcriptional regulator n=1 Tax=Alicyclobacillus contaminans TaxID=392016 RepID=UPI002480E795|nr:MerR family transcriptional regulator [Alicyclobacillus contaminans]
MPLFPIGIVQKLTGLTARQIRYYEEHGLVQPARSEGNQRLFSFDDVERLLEVRSWLDRGLNMAGVKAQLARRATSTPDTKRPEPSDKELYKWMQQQLGRPDAGPNEFQGDLSRFYRRK